MYIYIYIYIYTIVHVYIYTDSAKKVEPQTIFDNFVTKLNLKTQIASDVARPILRQNDNFCWNRLTEKKDIDIFAKLPNI